MQQRAYEVLYELIRHATVSEDPSASNIDLIDSVLQYLQLQHLPIRFVRMPNDNATWENLVVSVGPNTPGGVALCGHTDVVPVADQDWDSDPFTLTQRTDHRLVGRGVADMKGFLSVAIAQLAQVDPKRLVRPVHLVLTYDEEVGCHGAKQLLAELPDFRPDIAIFGEPTSMQLVDAHKGIRIVRTTVRGVSAHSSSPQLGTSAVQVAACLVDELYSIQSELEFRGGAMRFDPPCTTLNVGRIKGGSAVNTIADECSFDWEFRPVPGNDPDEVLRKYEWAVTELQGEFPNAHIATEVTASVPPLQSRQDVDALALVEDCLSAEDMTTAPYVTEAGLFQEAGISAVVCGPGELTQAHKPNESVSVAALEECERFVANLVASCEG